MKENEMTIVVNSCDKYSDIWDLYFEILHKQWPDCPFPIVLNTEHKSYSNPFFNIEVINLPNDKKTYTWSERLLLCINSINSKYVLSTLDDIYFLNRVDNIALNSLIRRIDKIKNFAMLSFYNYGPKYYKRGLDLYLCHRYCEFNYNITCNIWNRQYLLGILSSEEDIWQAESGIKNRMEKKGGKTFCIGNETVFLFNIYRYGLIQGKWACANVSFFEELKINHDFSKRGFYQIADSAYSINGDNAAFSEKSIWDKRIEYISRCSKYPYIYYTFVCWPKWMPQSIITLLKRVKDCFKSESRE